MIRLTITDGMLKTLAGGKALVEVVDLQGKTVGYYAPVTEEYARRLDAILSQVDQTELKRRRESPGPGYTTAEVFEHLLTLADDEETREDLRKRIEELRERDRCATP